MMAHHPISTDTDHQAALREIEELWGAAPGHVRRRSPRRARGRDRSLRGSALALRVSASRLKRTSVPLAPKISALNVGFHLLGMPRPFAAPGPWLFGNRGNPRPCIGQSPHQRALSRRKLIVKLITPRFDPSGCRDHLRNGGHRHWPLCRRKAICQEPRADPFAGPAKTDIGDLT